MFDEDELRTLLARADVPASGVETTRVLRDGHRRVRRRRLAGVGGTLAVVVTAAVAVPLTMGSAGRGGQPNDPATVAPATSAAAPSPSRILPTCSVHALAMPPEYQTWKTKPKFDRVEVNTADPTGRYIGGHAIIGQNFVPILWTDGVPKVLPIDPVSASIDEINEHGVVVGKAGALADRAYRYENGKVSTLRAPSGKPWLFPHPFINAAGDIVMNAKPQDAAGDGSRSVVVIWKAGTDTPVILPLPKYAGAQGITDDGMIFGDVGGSDGMVKGAYLWDQQGNGRELVAPGNKPASAEAARGDWVTGGTWRSQASGPEVMLWNRRTGEARLLSPGLGDSVNSSGWVVDMAPGGSVLVDGVSLDLPTVVPNNKAVPKAVAEDGRIAGDSFDGETSIPAQWRCQ